MSAAPTRPVLKIVIIEPDAEFRDVLVDVCETWGHDVTAYTDADAAIAAAETRAPEILLASGHGSGLPIGAIQRTRRAYPTIVFVAAFATTDAIPTDPLEIADFVLLKPFSAQQLFAILHGFGARKVRGPH